MLLWCDLETTGLDPKIERILEIGFVLTDDELNEEARASWVIPFDAPVDDFIRDMHSKSGLLTECKAVKVKGTSYNKIFDEMKAWLVEHLNGEKPPLCGSSVSFDKGFLKECPWIKDWHLLDLFHYRIIDVSSLKEMTARFWPEVFETRPKERKTHRSLPDLEDSIAELQHYRTHLRAV